VTKVGFKTKHYARTVHIDGVEGAGVLVSDNFFDWSRAASKPIGDPQATGRSARQISGFALAGSRD